MNLELKHLAPYLPYGLKIATGNQPIIRELTIGAVNSKDVVHVNTVLNAIGHKPLLLPLSVLMDRQVAILYFENDRELLGEDWTAHAKAKRFVELGHVDIISSMCEPYLFWEKLFKDYFDVFGLIDAGLALNKNDYPS